MTNNQKIVIVGNDTNLVTVQLRGHETKVFMASEIAIEVAQDLITNAKIVSERPLTIEIPQKIPL
jgi:hypothetical protein